MSDLELREATGDDLDTVAKLLDDNDLPSEDVRDGDATFYLAEAADANQEVVGIAGLESHGPAGLLRSVVVDPQYRGCGYGTDIVEAVRARATDAEIERLYLLTTTAEAFFGARGFEEVPRDAVPDAVRATTQFSELCPESATCMREER